MKISTILIAFSLMFAISCTNKKSESEHGHSHDTASHAHPQEGADANHGHEHAGDETSEGHQHDTHHEQEEFTVSRDSTKTENDSTQHTHEDGSLHHNH